MDSHIYNLWFYNGSDYSDAVEILVGVYSSRQLAEDAIERTKRDKLDKWPFYVLKEGHGHHPLAKFDIHETLINLDIY